MYVCQDVQVILETRAKLGYTNFGSKFLVVQRHPLENYFFLLRILSRENNGLAEKMGKLIKSLPGSQQT
jgi:hypothetical protein